MKYYRFGPSPSELETNSEKLEENLVAELVLHLHANVVSNSHEFA